VNKKKEIPIVSSAEDESPKTIIGVINDFHLRSMHNIIDPMVITYSPDDLRVISIKIKPDNFSETLAFIKQKWSKFDPDRPLDYSFLDESFDSQYKAEEKLSKIFSYFTSIAILIACLGLFGMASFLAEQRKKEIGIRKTLGAFVGSLVLMLVMSLLKWVVAGTLIAWPLSYYSMDNWLQDFAYKTDLNFLIFLFAGIMALLVALATVSYKAIRSANANPVDSLRYE